jgi:hypothetical protein
MNQHHKKSNSLFGIAVFALFSLCLVLGFYPADALAKLAPVTKAQVIRDFGRVSFEWPKETRIQAATKGNQVQIRFEQPASVDSAAILRNLRPYLSKVQQSNDGRSLTLTMNKAYKIRSFVSSNVSGVDILRLQEKPSEVDVKPEKKPQQEALAKPKPEPTEKPLQNVPFAKASEKPTEKTTKKTVVKPVVKPVVVAAVKPKVKPTAKPQEKPVGKPIAKPKPQPVKDKKLAQTANISANITANIAEVKKPAPVVEKPKPKPPVVATTPPPAPQPTAQPDEEVQKPPSPEPESVASSQSVPASEPQPSQPLTPPVLVAQEDAATVAPKETPKEAPQTENSPPSAPPVEASATAGAASSEPETAPPVQAALTPAAPANTPLVPTPVAEATEPSPSKPSESATPQEQQEPQDEPTPHAPKPLIVPDAPLASASGVQPPEGFVAPQQQPDPQASAPTEAADAASSETTAPSPEEATTETSPPPPQQTEVAATETVTTAEPSPPITAEMEAAPQTDALTVTAETKGKETIIHFPWSVRVAVAAFRRGNRDYLYFSKSAPINLAAVNAATGVDYVQMTPLGEGLLVMLQTDKKGLIVTKAKDEYAWHFQLTDAVAPPLRSVASIPHTEPPLKPHILLNALEVKDGVPWQDPASGENLTIVPSYRAGEGFYPSRDFVEFTLLQTSQGIVVQPKVEDLRVARTRNGMKITTPTGLTLSENLPPLAVNDLTASIDGDGTFYPHATWKTPEGKPSYGFANEIQREIPLASPVDKQALRLRLAQLHLAEQRPREALSLLNLIQREAPDFYKQNKLSALRGAANFLIYRYQEAAADFGDIALNGIPEMELWRDTLNILLTGNGKANYLDYEKNFTSKYPPQMAERLALTAADRLIENKQYNNALKILDALYKADPNNLKNKEFIEYQIARLSAASTEKKKAIAIWEKLATSSDNFIRSRSAFALTNLLLREGMIDIPEAIKRLDPLRILWRGDDFELGLLRFIGDLYEANNQPSEALRTYNELIRAFPSNPDNMALRGKMADIFVWLFNGGGADKMSPLEALALYYEFQDLTPMEDAGDKMVRNLADRLVQVDLLDRAAALLDHQVRYRLAGEERSKTGARLALIYLLNRQPKKALDVLELTGYGQNPETLQHHRTLLTARALADLKENARALNLLEGDTHPDSNQLRLTIHWDNRDWKQVIREGEAMMGQRQDPTAPITESESSTLLKLALAYVFERQNEQVQYLRDYFLPLMKGNKNYQLLDFVTKSPPVDYRDLSKLTRHINEMENFLANYRKKVQEEGLSKAIP